jgi:hypothetical protein
LSSPKAQGQDIRGTEFDGSNSNADIRVKIIRRMAPEPRSDATVSVELEGEAKSDDAVRTFGFVSMRSWVVVDCVRRRDRVRRMLRSQSPDFSDPKESPAPPGWAQPSQDAYLAGLIGAVCGPGPTADGVGANAQAGHAPARTPNSAPRPETAAPARSSTQAAHVTAGPASDGAGAPASTLVAQIVASETRAEAQSTLDKQIALRGPGLRAAIEALTVSGRLVYRAEVIGFASDQDARAFCAKVRRGGGACWLHEARGSSSAAAYPMRASLSGPRGTGLSARRP